MQTSEGNNINKQESIHIGIDLNRSAQIAITGLVRAINFNKYALAANYSYEEFKNFKSTNAVPLVFRRKDDSEELYLQDKQDYFNWLSVNGVREIVESFFSYIDDLLTCLTLTKTYALSTLTPEDIELIPRTIKDTPKPFTEKIKDLKKIYGFNIPKIFDVHLDYLENMRDCISHNVGIVSAKYFPQPAKGGNAARIEWLELKTFTTDSKTDKLIKLRGPTKEGIYIKAIQHEKILPYNKPIQIDLNELEMIAYTTFCIINAYKEEANNAINKLLANAGNIINEKSAETTNISSGVRCNV